MYSGSKSKLGNSAMNSLTALPCAVVLRVVPTHRDTREQPSSHTRDTSSVETCSTNEGVVGAALQEGDPQVQRFPARSLTLRAATLTSRTFRKACSAPGRIRAPSSPESSTDAALKSRQEQRSPASPPEGPPRACSRHQQRCRRPNLPRND